MTALVLCLAVVNLVLFAAKSLSSHGGRHSDRPLTALRLNKGLAGSPLQGLGFKLEAAGHRWRISPYFMAAASGTESSLGRVPCRENPRNIWGLGSCNSAWRVPYFESWAEAFNYYARFLRRTWPRARTAYDFPGYSACDSCWGSRTAYFMRALFGVGPEVRYP